MEKIKSAINTPKTDKVNQATLNRVCRVLHDLNESEIKYVRWAVKSCHNPRIRSSLILINHLGDGWLYLIIALLLLATQGFSSPLLLAAFLATLFAHCIYPFIKKSLARVRPCNYDLSLNLGVKLLDQYSCPSGHIMTATIIAIPLILTLPELLLLITIVYLLIGWARISLGHHYPSDLVLGAMLGTLITLPFCILLL